MGGAAAVERGYLAITFDGPGQGHALFEQGLPFRPDWEAVITPVVDHLLARDDVDPERIALHGVSQAGYWVPRAVAFEHRIAAAVADPGVMDVSTSWTDHLPARMASSSTRADPRSSTGTWPSASSSAGYARRQLAFRMRPYGAGRPVRGLPGGAPVPPARRGRAHHLPDADHRPGRRAVLAGPVAGALRRPAGPKRLVRFTEEEGANWHCEPMALGLRDQRVFDWLDETLGVTG